MNRVHTCKWLLGEILLTRGPRPGLLGVLIEHSMEELTIYSIYNNTEAERLILLSLIPSILLCMFTTVMQLETVFLENGNFLPADKKLLSKNVHRSCKISAV